MKRIEMPVGVSGRRGKKALAKFLKRTKTCPFQKLLSHVLYTTIAANLPAHVPGRLPKERGRVVEMHFPADDITDEHHLELISTMLNQLNVFQGDRFQLCGYFCSMVATFFPGWTETVKTAFNENMDVPVKEIPTDEMREMIGVQPMWSLPGNAALVYLGQAIFLLYKNINQSNYVGVMERRIAAMKVICGVPENVQINIIMTLEKAKIVNRMLGSDHTLRKTMLEIILRSIVMEGKMGQLCNYLASILENTDMDGIVFITKALVVTNSPALRRSEIAQEFRNFCMAISVINDTNLPKYFKILYPTHQTSIADRNKFPTLIALAERILKEETPSSDHRLMIPGNVSDRLLTELERVHYARNESESESEEIPKKKKFNKRRR